MKRSSVAAVLACLVAVPMLSCGQDFNDQPSASADSDASAPGSAGSGSAGQGGASGGWAGEGGGGWAGEGGGGWAGEGGGGGVQQDGGGEPDGAAGGDPQDGGAGQQDGGAGMGGDASDAEVCPEGLGDCDDDLSNGCETPLDTNDDCGACDNPCAGEQSCVDFACRLECIDSSEDCDSDPDNGCETDLSSDVDHCSACDNPCPDVTNGYPTCVDSLCGLKCNQGWSDCDGSEQNGCEINTVSDVSNCGACDHACPSVTNAMSVCSGSSCGFVCNAGRDDCNQNAGDGCETNTTNSVSHCGGCGNLCPPVTNATPMCSGSSCGFVCDAGRDDCNQNAVDGCETNTTNSVSHCGGCGNLCPPVTNATPVCSGSSCGFVCDAGRDDCNQNAVDGCEINTTSDVDNCGGCYDECPSVTNATPTCTGSSCGFVCNTDRQDCNENPSDGCEINTTNDVSHCGDCTTECADKPNSVPKCSNSSCTFTCESGWGNCDVYAFNGCESHLTNDVKHCGACNNPCPALSHAIPGCYMSTCMFTCEAGWKDCNSGAGCETHTDSDPNNCGACGNKCLAGYVCTNGACKHI